MEIHRFVDLMANGFELVGTATMVVGALVSVVLTIVARSQGCGLMKDYRHRLGRAIVLGLEFLIAADILRTVTADRTLESVAILGGIVLIRSFLTFSLEVEMEGSLPWQRAAAEPQRTQ